MDNALKRIYRYDAHEILYSGIKNHGPLTLQNIKAVKIFYCFYGRNAWYTTWVQKYTENCMHSSLESAKEFAEENRVSGSVFYIEELPALFLEGGYYPVLVTQINQANPLKGYSSKLHKNNLLILNVPIKDAILSFDYNSPFWKLPQQKNDSVILLYSKLAPQFEYLKTTKLRTWKSESFGGKYCLSWNLLESRVRQSSLLRIYKQSGFNQKTLNKTI